MKKKPVIRVGNESVILSEKEMDTLLRQFFTRLEKPEIKAVFKRLKNK